MKIGVIGTGYVGLVTGVCLASKGNEVICSDVDESKIEKLKQGEIPIFEPGLKELLESCRENITFTTDVAGCIKDSEIIFSAVGTPSNSDGSANLTYVNDVAKIFGENCVDGKDRILVGKSTVPVGTMKGIENALEDFGAKNFHVASSPETLREGFAVYDVLNPDRIIFGSKSNFARDKLRELYSGFDAPIIETSSTGASEMAKYGANAMLAIRITFADEVARLCDETGDDVSEVMTAVGLDHRIGPYFLNPGPGYGGSCFPKDTLAFAHAMSEFGINSPLISSVTYSNDIHKDYVAKRAVDFFQTCSKILVLGLAFKERTDDVRKTASKEVIVNLLAKTSAKIVAHDQYGVSNFKEQCMNGEEIGRITYFSTENSTEIAEVASECDGVIVMVPSDLYKEDNVVNSFKKGCKIYDTRNILNAEKLVDVEYMGMGRK